MKAGSYRMGRPREEIIRRFALEEIFRRFAPQDDRRLRRRSLSLLVLDALEEAGAVAQALHHLLLERPAAAGDVAGVGEDAAGALFLPGGEQRHAEVGERAL